MRTMRWVKTTKLQSESAFKVLTGITQRGLIIKYKINILGKT